MQQSGYFDYLPNNDSTPPPPPQQQQQQVQPMEAFYGASSSSALQGLPRTDEDDKIQSGGALHKGGTDFRRKKNWSERILVELTGLLHVLSPYGNILYCSESTLELTGYRPHELVGQKLVEFLHVDDMDIFIRDFQMSFHTRSRITTYYRFRKKDESYVLFEVVGQPGAQVAGQRPDAFYGIAQLIPSKSGASIDAFLEEKSENEWLKARIDELSKKYGKIDFEHVEDEVLQQFETTSIDEPFTNSGIYSQRNPGDSSDEPKSWFDNHNLKTGDVVDKTNDTYQKECVDKKDKWKRRKKNKEADEFVCKDCGTTSSPEWRKGPQGPKTLCNACGLRWSKRNRKKGMMGD